MTGLLVEHFTAGFNPQSLLKQVFTLFAVRNPRMFAFQRRFVGLESGEAQTYLVIYQSVLLRKWGKPQTKQRMPMSLPFISIPFGFLTQKSAVLEGEDHAPAALV